MKDNEMDFMQLKFGDKSIIWCHWDLARFLEEENANLNKHVIGLNTYMNRKDNGEQVLMDLRIFLYKEDDKFKVRVYEDDENFKIFEFDTFDEARDEFDMIPYRHPEYQSRPMIPRNKDNTIMVFPKKEA